MFEHSVSYSIQTIGSFTKIKNISNIFHFLPFFRFYFFYGKAEPQKINKPYFGQKTNHAMHHDCGVSYLFEDNVTVFLKTP